MEALQKRYTAFKHGWRCTDFAQENCRFKRDTIFFFFFTKGSSSEWASKALPETSSIATVTDVVEVIPSNSQENSQTTDSNILSTEKRKG